MTNVNQCKNNMNDLQLDLKDRIKIKIIYDRYVACWAKHVYKTNFLIT